MQTRRSRRILATPFAVETLEGRVVMSGVGAASGLPQGAVEVAAQSVHKAATQTTLAIKTGTLGQPIQFTVTVKAAASAGSPQGTVNIVDRGQVLGTLTLSPSATVGKSATSTATVTLAPQAGGAAYYFGQHPITAQFIPGGAFSKSTVTKTFTVAPASYTTLADGVKIATIAPGSGAAIQSGQTANVLYTGYLAKNGHIFDDSSNDGGTPLGFTLGGGSVIPGFDAGTVGMKVGETRLILIPPSAGYGATANGSIPANSSLLFVQTLESIT